MFVKYACASLLLVVSLVGSVIAQDTVTTQPLILLRPSDQYDMGVGDLWEWTGGPTLRQKTQWGYNEELRLSPLNNEVAYHSWAQLWVNSIEQNGMTSGGRFPGNIWVITTENTDLGDRIADQPADAVITAEGPANNTLLRSAPMWSPDGTQVAWAERRERAFEAPEPYRLVVYDKATQTTRTLVEALPSQYGIDTGIEGYWVGNGIVIVNQPEDAPNPFDVSLLIYDASTGEQRFNIPVSSFIEVDNQWPALTTAVQVQGKPWLGLLYIVPGEFKHWQWHFIDIETGSVMTPSDARPIALVADHPDTSIRVQIDFASDQNVFYSVTGPDGSPLNLGLGHDYFVRKFALSPDGQAIAYQAYGRSLDLYSDTLWVWRDGEITQAIDEFSPAAVSEFVWGTATWVLEDSALGQ